MSKSIISDAVIEDLAERILEGFDGTPMEKRCGAISFAAGGKFTRDLMKEKIVAPLKTEIKDLEWQVKQLEKAATDWMNDYQKIKDKYEPDILAEQHAERIGEPTKSHEA